MKSSSITSTLPSLAPSKKKRKLAKNDDSDDDEKLLDLSNCDNTNNSSTRKKGKTGGRKKYSKADKLSTLGGHLTKYGTDLSLVRHKVLSLVTNQRRCEAIIQRIDYDMKLRAQGNTCYEDVQTSNNRIVKKKLPLLSHLKYA